MAERTGEAFCPPYSGGQCIVSQPRAASFWRICQVCSQLTSSEPRSPSSHSGERSCWINSRSSPRKASSSTLNRNSTPTLLLGTIGPVISSLPIFPQILHTCRQFHGQDLLSIL